MKYSILQCEQGSDEWRKARAGRLTGSRAVDMLTKIKSGEAAARRDLRLSLALELLTGLPEEEGYVSPEMKRGTEKEPEIFGAYEAATGQIVERTGFLVCDSILAGCSLDGHVGNFEGIIEGKAPKSATHLRYLKGGVIPSEYIGQCTHNLWVSGAKWCDFISWDDRFPAHLQLFIKRMYRIESEMAAYEAEAMRFLAEVAIELSGLKSLKVAA